MKVQRILSAAVRGVVVAALFVGSGTAASAQDRLDVVATFTILGDLVSVIGGDRVAVTSLVGPGGDAHVFEPSPSDARAVAGADLVVANGLGFEGWIDRLVEAAAYHGTVVIASAGVVPLAFDEHDELAASGHAHEDDPHAWQAVANARLYVANIADALIAEDPAGEAMYRANLAAYLAALDTLEADIGAAVAALPEAARTIITSHDAFGYFADAYGLTFLAPLGVSTEAEPTPAAVAALIDQIRATGVRAVFIESMADPRLIGQIAQETGAVVGGELYADALTAAGGPAPTYLAMMRHNIRTISAAAGG